MLHPLSRKLRMTPLTYNRHTCADRILGIRMLEYDNHMLVSIKRVVRNVRASPRPELVTGQVITRSCATERALVVNPIEEFFAKLKAFIKRNWQLYTDLPRQDFGEFLEWCVDTVGARKSSAEGHFRHIGISIEEPCTLVGGRDMFILEHLQTVYYYDFVLLIWLCRIPSS
jgi:hypothetical protein